MRLNLCSNVNNGVGLQRDCELLKSIFESWGHRVELVHYKRIDGASPQADVNIFLEVIEPALFPKAKQQWFIPNPEWYARCDHDNVIAKFEYILCKTNDAIRIFKELYPELQNRVKFIGFESADLFEPDTKRERRFLHVAGQSRYKNTPSVAYAFAKFAVNDNHIPLTIVGAYPDDAAFARDHANVKYIQTAAPAELKRLMNTHQFHVMPSGYEGWGHALHEGMSCGAVIITTDHPPMNDVDGLPKELLVKPDRVISELSATRALVVANPLWAAVTKAWNLKEEQIHIYSAAARTAFKHEKECFRDQLYALVGGTR